MSRHCEHCGTGRQCYSTTTTVHSVECPYCLAAEVEALRGENKALKYMVERDTAAIQRVRELHYNTATHHPSGCCSECGGTYPCPTVRAFDGGAE